MFCGPIFCDMAATARQKVRLPIWVDFVANRPMSSRSQALFRSITEVKHVLRQHYLQFNQRSRCSFNLFSSPEMVVENPACVAGRISTGVGTTIPTQGTSPT